MPLILLIDDALFCRELVGKALRQEGYEVMTAANGRDGLVALQKCFPQLIILDNQMPLMNGVTFLRSLREDPAKAGVPVIMLTSSGQKETVLKAKHLGAIDYILKSEFSLGKLLERVRRWLPIGSLAADSVISDAVNGPRSEQAVKDSVAPIGTNQPHQTVYAIRKQVIAAIDMIDDARTLGGVVEQVLAIANSPRDGLRELVQVVQQDPVLSARALRLANSVAFASERPAVTSLGDAIRNIGADGIRKLAMSLGVFDTFSAGGVLDPALIRCWAHALAVAGIMDRISAGENKEQGSQADGGIVHLVGLCHDLGEILLRQRFATQFAEAEEAALAQGVCVLRILPEIYGISYDEITERLLAKLAVPIKISQSILEHARMKAGKTISAKTPIARLLGLADSYANGSLLASSVTAMVSTFLSTDFPDPELVGCDGLKNEIMSTICAIANLTPAEQTELRRPLLPQHSLSITYFRDRCLSACDPIEIALRAMCEVKTVHHLPAFDEQFAEGTVVAIATARLDTLCVSTGGHFARPATKRMAKGLCFFVAHNGREAFLENNSRRVYSPYPISLQSLNGLLVDMLLTKSAVEPS